MKRNTVKMIALGLFPLTPALGVLRHAQAQDAENPYPTSMVPLDQYLMGRDAEIALARSAAPLRGPVFWSTPSVSFRRN